MATKTAKRISFSKCGFLRGSSQFFSWPVALPHIVSPAADQNIRMKVDCNGEHDVTPIFAKIIPTDIHRIDKNAYLIPEAQFFFIFSPGSCSHKTQLTPITVRGIPIQVRRESFSCKKTTARMTVNTGPSAPNNTVSLGPKNNNALKKKVSPKVIPSKPLIPRNKKVRLVMGSIPNTKSIAPRYNIPIMPFPRFIPSGETSSPSLRNKIEPNAHAAADVKAAKLPSVP